MVPLLDYTIDGMSEIVALQFDTFAAKEKPDLFFSVLTYGYLHRSRLSSQLLNHDSTQSSEI
ncbi:hypothetical protein [Coleofasciculus sp. E2-BRE-01]|uniref:hypothetical protein n=1 Tax=Coleofasciculus sp. E2-BRE-01 TaxID=3069524 RepID=UPI0032F7DDF2